METATVETSAATLGVAEFGREEKNRKNNGKGDR
jgi:hypothetical protein